MQRDFLQPVDELWTIGAGAPTPAMEAVGMPQFKESTSGKEEHTEKNSEEDPKMNQNNQKHRGHCMAASLNNKPDEPVCNRGNDPLVSLFS